MGDRSSGAVVRDSGCESLFIRSSVPLTGIGQLSSGQSSTYGAVQDVVVLRDGEEVGGLDLVCAGGSIAASFLGKSWGDNSYNND